MKQREIKFRAWDKVKMSYEPLVFDGECSGEFSMVQLNKAFSQGGDADGKGNAIFMQYTGLKDKNGKEIYEGDICKTNDIRLYGEPEIFEIAWDPEWISFAAKSKGNYIKIHNNGDSSLIEIVGNIYENPELLEEK